jgi:hypothetical protein
MVAFRQFRNAPAEECPLIFLAAFFFPIAVYCLILGMLNRRPTPVLVGGLWDCLGLLLATSGLVLFGGPAILAALYQQEVRDFLLGKPRWANIDFGELLEFWWRVWLLYYLAVLGGGALLLWLRRGVTSVYNVEPAAFDDILAHVLDKLGLEWTRLGDRVFIGPHGTLVRGGTGPAKLPDSPGLETSPPRRAQGPEAILDLEPFFATRHVTVHWRSATGSVRAEVEAELVRVLNQVAAPANPAGNWFMITASCLFALIFICVAVNVFLQIYVRKIG